MKHHTYDHLNNEAADMRYRLAASYLTTPDIKHIIEIGGFNPNSHRNHEPKILRYLPPGHFSTVTIIDPKAPEDEFYQDIYDEHRVTQMRDTFQNVMTNRFAELMMGKLYSPGTCPPLSGNGRIGLCIMGCSLHLDRSKDYSHLCYLMEESDRVILEYRLTNPLGVQQVADLTEWLVGFGLHEKLAEIQFNSVDAKGYVNTSEVFHDPRRFIAYQRRA
jgi:hypothetical protein